MKEHFTSVEIAAYWTDDTWHPIKDCRCMICQYIDCNIDDSEFVLALRGRTIKEFDERLEQLGIMYSCYEEEFTR